MLDKIISKKRTETFVIFTFFGKWQMKVRPYKSLSEKIKKLEKDNQYLLYRIKNLPYELKDSDYLNTIKIPKVATVEQTLDKISNEQVSLARFGDGELMLMFRNRPIRFQEVDAKLQERLKEVLSSNIEGMCIALSDNWGYLHYPTEGSQKIWAEVAAKCRKPLYEHINLSKDYYNSNVTRISSIDLFNKYKQFFKDKKLVIVEGDKTRFGIGNDLIAEAKEIKRILCPAKNAFSRYDKILNACKSLNVDNDTIFLIALGPTATVLAYDLHRLGKRALDIGHLDICYEWSIRANGERINISDKYVNEVNGGDTVQDCKDKAYLSQIVEKIV